MMPLSLAFFSAARTGEVQSRMSSDIAGLQSLFTNTASDAARNISVVLTTVVAMVLLDWRLALAVLGRVGLEAVLAQNGQEALEMSRRFPRSAWWLRAQALVAFFAVPIAVTRSTFNGMPRARRPSTIDVAKPCQLVLPAAATWTRPQAPASWQMRPRP